MPRKWKNGAKKLTVTKYKPRRKYTRKLKVSRQIGFGFPSTNVVKMRYCEVNDITLTAGFAQYQFVANGLFDPDFTGGGHQPLGFDQWKLFYNHYVVLGSKCSFTITGANSGVTGSCTVNCQLSDDTAVPTDIQTLMESGRGTTRVVNGFTGINPVTVRSKFSAKKFFSITNVKDNVTRIGAPTNANPTDIAVYTLTMFNKSLATPDMSITTMIEYIVLFNEPKDLEQS